MRKLKSVAPFARNRKFESSSLQRGVCEPSVPLGFRDCRRGSIRRAARPAYLDSADLRVDPKVRRGMGWATRMGFTGWNPAIPDMCGVATPLRQQNLTMRMSMRRFTRLTNAFSKKAENHAHSVAIHFMHYNFVRIHQSLRVTPAMAAGVTNTLWSLTDMAIGHRSGSKVAARSGTFRRGLMSGR